MLLKRGVAVLEDAIPAPNAGCKISNGANTVTIRFKNCVYQGRLNGQTLSGNGTFTSGADQGRTWSFQVALAKN